MKCFTTVVLITGMAFIGLTGCNDQNKKQIQGKKAEEKAVSNIFHDANLQTIYTLQNKRDAAGLEAYLKDPKAVYRKAAALAFASVQEKASVPKIARLLKDENLTIRSASAYSLGQIDSPEAEPLLIEAFKNETVPSVKQDILEALGKCGTQKGLDFITSLPLDKSAENSQIPVGMAMGIYRYGLRKIATEKGTSLAFSLLSHDYPANARMMAAQYLAKTRELDLKDFHKILLQVFLQENDLYARMALAAAMGKAQTPEILQGLKDILNTVNEDYRVKVNALYALGRFDYRQVKDIMWSFVAAENVNMAIMAGEYFAAKGIESDALSYFEKAKSLTSWRPRFNLLKAALTYLPEKDIQNRTLISQWTMNLYIQSTNDYEKAWLMNVLALDPAHRAFLEEQTFGETGKKALFGTYGMEALSNMFQAIHKAGKINNETMDTFAAIFRKGLESRDNSIITIAAGVMANPDFGFKDYYKDKDTGFMLTALANCQLPAEYEAWQELKKSITYITGKDVSPAAQTPALQDIDWELVKSIAPEQQIQIETDKGPIVIQLMVEQSPGSVANFLRLIREDFFHNSYIHRVVPNFVVQDGCPRGDGWGGPPYAIGSELGPLYYNREGMVGMASAGKDTEGSQWFITHSPTPHLDGRYTIFAHVVSGMKVVHNLEVGDRIRVFKEL